MSRAERRQQARERRKAEKRGKNTIVAPTTIPIENTKKAQMTIAVNNQIARAIKEITDAKRAEHKELAKEADSNAVDAFFSVLMVSMAAGIEECYQESCHRKCDAEYIRKRIQKTLDYCAAFGKGEFGTYDDYRRMVYKMTETNEYSGFMWTVEGENAKTIYGE